MRKIKTTARCLPRSNSKLCKTIIKARLLRHRSLQTNKSPRAARGRSFHTRTFKRANTSIGLNLTYILSLNHHLRNVDSSKFTTPRPNVSTIKRSTQVMRQLDPFYSECQTSHKQHQRYGPHQRNPTSDWAPLTWINSSNRHTQQSRFQT